MIEAGGEGISRRVLLIGAGGVAGAAVATAAATPLASLGPTLNGIHTKRRGRAGPAWSTIRDVRTWPTRSISARSTPRCPSTQIRSVRRRVSRGAAAGEFPPPARGPPRLGPAGIVAYSKICPHAGCAISLYRYPDLPAHQPAAGVHLPVPLLDVPPGEGGRVMFGPAGRALPQLPLMIDPVATCAPPGRFTRTSAPPGGACIGRSREPRRALLHRRLERAAALERAARRAWAIKWAMRYVFPDHWSFLLGEIALYSFIVLVGTGIFLTLYYSPAFRRSSTTAPIRCFRRADVGGLPVGAQSLLHRAGRSAVPPGPSLGRRRVHRRDRAPPDRVFFTGAYRKPRDINYFIGLTMLMLAILEGFAGYSLVDDLLSGMGLAIAYSVAMSIPVSEGSSAT